MLVTPPHFRSSGTFVCPTHSQVRAAVQRGASFLHSLQLYGPAASTVTPSDKETGPKRVSRRLPAHHLSICCSLCLDYSSPVTIPAYLQVSPQISPERALPWAPAISLPGAPPSREHRPPHACVFCPSSPTGVPQEGPDPCWIPESRDPSLTPSSTLLHTWQTSTDTAHIRDRASM